MNKFSFLFTVGAALAIPSASLNAIAQQRPKPAAKAEQAPAMAGPRFVQRQKVSVAHGEKIFVEYCAVCHGLQGKGDGPRAAFFADVQYIPDLTLEGFLEKRDAELLTNIREGLARYDEPAIVMPQFKYILGESDIQSTLAYVKTFAAREAQRTKPR